MMVNGRDHDMLIICDMLTVCNNDLGKKCAYEVAKVEDLNHNEMTPEEAATLLAGAGEPAIAYCGHKETILLLAKGYAHRGCPTMIQMDNPHNRGEHIWHLMVDPVNNMIGTICHEPDPGPAQVLGSIADYFTGAAVTVTRVAPGWKGSWDRLLNEHAPR